MKSHSESRKTKTERKCFGGSDETTSPFVFRVLSVVMLPSPWSAWCTLPLTPSSEVPLCPGQHRQSPGDTSPIFSERPWLRRHFLFETIYPASVRKSQWEPPAAPGMNCLLCEMPTCLLRWVRRSRTKSPCTELSGFWAPQLQITQEGCSLYEIMSHFKGFVSL